MRRARLTKVSPLPKSGDMLLLCPYLSPGQMGRGGQKKKTCKSCMRGDFTIHTPTERIPSGLQYAFVAPQQPILNKVP